MLAFLPVVLSALRPARPCTTMMSFSKASLFFDFNQIPFAAGIQHIHSPEYFAGAHNLAPAMFEIESVGAPRCLDAKTTITFNCSTLFLKHLCVRMSSSQPNESNLLFFKDGRALYGLRFTVIPARAFMAHRLQLDVTFFTDSRLYRADIKSLMPIFLFLNGMDDCYQPTVAENANFTRYRRAVLRGQGSSEFWIMAERVIRAYE